MTKPTKWHIPPVWSESSLCAQWVAKDPRFLHADSEDSDQTERMPRLIWVFAGRTGHFVIAPLWKSGDYTGFALSFRHSMILSFCHSVTFQIKFFCPSVILWFCHSVTFQIKIFVTLFTGTVRPRKLKLGTRVDSGRMYRIYRNQAAAAYLSFYCFIFLSLQFSNIKIFQHTFLRDCEA